MNTKTMNFTLCVVLCLLTLAEDNFERKKSTYLDLTDFVHVTVIYNRCLCHTDCAYLNMISMLFLVNYTVALWLGNSSH